MAYQYNTKVTRGNKNVKYSQSTKCVGHNHLCYVLAQSNRILCYQHICYQKYLHCLTLPDTHHYPSVILFLPFAASHLYRNGVWLVSNHVVCTKKAFASQFEHRCEGDLDMCTIA
jgi:hypothetical protein